MIKHTLIFIITAISMIGCGGGGGGGGGEIAEPQASVAPVAPQGFTYKTSQDLSLNIDVEYDEPNNFNTSTQRQIIIKTSPDYAELEPGEVLSDEAVVLKNSVITPNETFNTSLNLGNHIDEITISIPSLFYECVFTVNNIEASDIACQVDDYNRTITVTEYNEG